MIIVQKSYHYHDYLNIHMLIIGFHIVFGIIFGHVKYLLTTVISKQQGKYDTNTCAVEEFKWIIYEWCK